MWGSYREIQWSYLLVRWCAKGCAEGCAEGCATELVAGASLVGSFCAAGSV